jgi:serine protease inhibitor
MFMKKSLLGFSVMALMFIAGCGSSATIGNVSVPGGARNVENREMGKNKALVYITSESVDQACATQAKLFTDAKWTAENELRREDTYATTTYSDGKSSMVLMCSETELSATEKATKVTLTLMAQ